MSENMIDPGRSGDDAATALDAALAAADQDLLAAIGNGLDLDTGLARILEDLGGSAAARPGIQALEHSGKGWASLDAAISRDSSPPVRARGAGAAAPTGLAGLIRRASRPGETLEDQCRRARQAADVAARSARAAELSAADADTAETAHRAIQAGCPRRRAPLPRQVSLALGTAALDGAACYAAGRGLHGQDTARACLYTLATAGFLSLGYRFLRTAETPSAWRARRQARQARQAAQAARAMADQDAAERDRLIDACLRRFRQLAPGACPAEQELAVESELRMHLLGEYPLGQEEAWRPSRTLAILYRLRAGSRSAWGRWKASADTRA